MFFQSRLEIIRRSRHLRRDCKFRNHKNRRNNNFFPVDLCSNFYRRLFPILFSSAALFLLFASSFRA